MSNSIEEKIVEMRFDYKQFQEGAGKSIDTLAKLEEAIDKTAKKDFVDLNKAAKAVDLSSITNSIQEIEKRSSAMGVVTKRIFENLTDSAMGFASKALGPITKTLGFVKDSIVSGGLNRAMKVEDARFTLQSLFKDASKVEAIMKNVSDAVSGTRFGLDAAASAASQFASSGIEAGKAMETALGAVTGVASLTNSEYEDIARVFTGITGTGKVLGQDLIQLSSRGMNAAAAMAQFFNNVKNGSMEASDGVKQTINELTKDVGTVTESTIRDIISNPKTYIPAQVFLEAMSGMYKDAAFAANETFKGSFANLKSAFARIGEGFFTPIYKSNSDVVKLFNALREKVNDFKSALVFDEKVGNEFALMKQLSDGVLNLSRVITKFVKDIDVETVMMNFYTGLQGVKDVLEGIWSIIGPVFKAFRDVFLNKNLVDGVDSFLSSFEDILFKMRLSKESSTNLYKTFKGAFDGIATVAGTVLRVLGSILKPFGNIIDGLGNLLDVVLQVTGAFGEFISTISEGVAQSEILQVVLDSIEYIIENIMKVFKNATGLVRNFFAAFKDSIFAKLYIIALYKTWKLLTGDISDFTNLISYAFKALGRILYTFIPDRAIKLLTVFAGGLYKVYDILSNLTFFKPLKVYGATLTDEIGATQENVSTLQKIIQTIKDFVSARNEASNPSSNINVPFYITAFENLKDRIFAVINAIKEFDLQDLPGSFYKIIEAVITGSKGFDALQKYIITIFTNIVNKVKHYINIILGFVYGLYNSFTGLLAKYNINISPASILGIITSVQIIRLVSRFIKMINQLTKLKIPVLKDLSKTIDDIGKAVTEFGGLIKGIKGYLNIRAMNETIQTVSLLVIVIAATLAVLSVLPFEPNRLIEIAVSLGTVLAIVGTVVTALGITITVLSQFANWKSILSLLGGIGLIIAAIGLTLFAISDLFKVNLSDLRGFTKKITILISLFGGLAILLTLLTAANLISNGKGMKGALHWIGMSILLQSMVFGVVKIFKMETPSRSEINKKLEIFRTIIIGTAALVMALGFASIPMGKLGALSLIGTAILLGSVINAFIKVMKINLPSDYQEKMVALTYLFGLTAGLMVAVGLASRIGGGYKFFGLTLIGLSLMLSSVIKSMNSLFKMNIPTDYINKLTLFIATVGILALEISIAARIAGRANSLGWTLIGLSTLMLTLTVSLLALTILPWNTILKGVIFFGTVFATLGLTFAGLGTIWSKIEHFKVLLGAGVIIGVLVAALSVLYSFDWQGVLSAAIGLGICLAALSLTFRSLNNQRWSMEKLVAVLEMSALLVTITMTLEKLLNQNLDAMVVQALSINLILLGLILSARTISKMPTVKKDKIILLGELIAFIAAAGFGLSLVASKNWASIMATIPAMFFTLYALRDILVTMSRMPVNNTDALVPILDLLSLLLGVTVSLYFLSSQNWKVLLASAASLSAVILTIGQIFKTVVNLRNEDGKKNVELFGKIAWSLLVASGALTLLATRNWKQILAAAVAMSGVLYIMGAVFKLIANTQYIVDKRNMALYGAITASLIAIAGSLYVLSQRDWKSILVSSLSILPVLALLGYIANKLITIPDKAYLENAAIIGSLALSITSIAIGLSFLAKYNWKQILAASGSSLLVMTVFSRIVERLLHITDQVPYLNSAIILSTGLVIVGIINAVSKLAKYDWKMILAATYGTNLVINALSGLLHSMGNIGGNGIDALNLRRFALMGSGLLAAIVTIVAIAHEIKQMKDVSGLTVFMSTKGISLILDSIGKLIMTLSQFTMQDREKDMIGMLISLGEIIGAVFVLTASLKSLGGFDLYANNILAASAGLIILINGIALAMRILQNVEIDKENISNNLWMIGAFVTSCLGLIVPLKILGEANISPQGMATAVGGLAAMLMAITGALLLFNKVEIDQETLTASLITLLAFTAITYAMIIPIRELSKLDAKSMIASVGAMALMLGAMVGLEFVLGYVGKVAETALAGAAALIGIGLILGAGLLILGVIFGDPNVMRFVEEGTYIFEQIGNAFGMLVGGFLGKIAQYTMAGVGSGLGDFWTNAEPFFNGIKDLTMKHLQGVGILSGVFLALCAADIITGIRNFIQLFTGGNFLASFSQYMNGMGASITELSKSLGGMSNKDIRKVEYASNILSSFATFATSIPSNKDIGLFGEQLATFARSAKLVAIHAKHIPENYNDLTDKLVNMATAMIDVAKEIPNSGGWTGRIMGNNDIDDFGNRVEIFAHKMRAFTLVIKRIPTNSFENTDLLKNMATAMIDVAKEIPQHGGWAGAIMGENDIDDFGNRLSAFAVNMVAFADKVKDLNSDHLRGARYAARMMSALFDAANEDNIHNVGGLLGFLLYNRDATTLDNLSNVFDKLGGALAKFGNHVSGLTTKNVTSATRAMEILGSIVLKMNQMNEPNQYGNAFDMFEEQSDGNGKTYTKFDQYSKVLIDFANAIGQYYTTIKNIDPKILNAATTVISNLLKLAETDITKLGNLGTTLTDFATVSITSYVATFENSHELIIRTINRFINVIRDTLKSDDNKFKFGYAAQEDARTFLDAFCDKLTDDFSKTQLENTVDSIVDSFATFFLKNDNLTRMAKIGRTMYYMVTKTMEHTAEEDARQSNIPNNTISRNSISSNKIQNKRTISKNEIHQDNEFDKYLKHSDIEIKNSKKRYGAAKETAKQETLTKNSITEKTAAIGDYVKENLTLENVLDKLNTVVEKLGFSLDDLGSTFDNIFGLFKDNALDIITGETSIKDVIGGYISDNAKEAIKEKVGSWLDKDYPEAKEWYDKIFNKEDAEEELTEDITDTVKNAVSNATGGLGSIGSDLGASLGEDIGDGLEDELSKKIKGSKGSKISKSESNWLSVLKEHSDKIIAAHPEIFKSTQDVINHLLKEENRQAFINTMKALTGIDISNKSIDEIDKLRIALAELYDTNESLNESLGETSKLSNNVNVKEFKKYDKKIIDYFKKNNLDSSVLEKLTEDHFIALRPSNENDINEFKSLLSYYGSTEEENNAILENTLKAINSFDDETKEKYYNSINSHMEWFNNLDKNTIKEEITLTNRLAESHQELQESLSKENTVIQDQNLTKDMDFESKKNMMRNIIDAYRAKYDPIAEQYDNYILDYFKKNNLDTYGKHLEYYLKGWYTERDDNIDGVDGIMHGLFWGSDLDKYGEGSPEWHRALEVANNIKKALYEMDDDLYNTRKSLHYLFMNDENIRHFIGIRNNETSNDPSPKESLDSMWSDYKDNIDEAIKSGTEKLALIDKQNQITNEVVVQNKHLAESNQLVQESLDNVQTKFGNIDVANRQVIKWDDNNLNKFKNELLSWNNNLDELKGSISTIMGTSGEFNGMEIAFSPILQTDHGAELLNKDTVYKYISTLLDTVNDSNGWTTEELIALDAQGLDIDGKHISNLIADIGDTAVETAKKMHDVAVTLPDAANNYNNELTKENQLLEDNKLLNEDIARLQEGHVSDRFSSQSLEGTSVEEIAEMMRNSDEFKYLTNLPMQQLHGIYAKTLARYTTQLGAVMANKSSDVSKSMPNLNGGQYISGMNSALYQMQDQLDQTNMTVPVTPVLNLNNAQNPNLSALNDAMNSSSLYAYQSLAPEQLQTMMSANAFDDSDVLNGINGLNDTLTNLSDKMDNMQIVMDSGQLVGAITPKIDASLSRMIARKARS